MCVCACVQTDVNVCLHVQGADEKENDGGEDASLQKTADVPNRGIGG